MHLVLTVRFRHSHNMQPVLRRLVRTNRVSHNRQPNISEDNQSLVSYSPVVLRQLLVHPSISVCVESLTAQK